MTAHVVATNTVQDTTFATVTEADPFFSFAGTTLLVTGASALVVDPFGRLIINGSVLGGDLYVIEKAPNWVPDVSITIGPQGSVQGGTATAIVGGYGWTIDNAGLISGPSAIYLDEGGGVVNNTGEIRGSMNPSNQTLVMSISGNDLFNHGLISGTFGVNAMFSQTVVNTGTITSLLGWGLLIGLGTTVNSGLIYSAQGTGVVMTTSFSALENSGTISGGLAAVYGEDGVEIILNTGTLSGDVILQGGNDVLDGRLGTQTGLVDGGGGDDLLLLGRAGEEAFGGSGRDTIRGGDGDDTVEGGADADELDGGAGRDLLDYRGSGGGVRVSLEDGRGFRGDARGDTLTGFEDVSGTSYADVIEGDGGANLLDGRERRDLLAGGGGQDTLHGGAGADTLFGGAGGDVLRGQGGADTFLYTELSDSAPDGAGRDRIFGFLTAHPTRVNDVIDLSALDADALTDGDQAFTFIGDAGFTAAGQLRAERLANGDTLVQAEVDGDNRADFAILLVRLAPTLTEDAFNL
jgi:Ca2+-binding RTX toxin-like protein